MVRNTPSEEQKDPVMYTDPEVSDIMASLQRVYSLDDAIYSQTQLNRPEGFIKPLRELRQQASDHLIEITSKSLPAPVKPVDSQ